MPTRRPLPLKHDRTTQRHNSTTKTIDLTTITCIVVTTTTYTTMNSLNALGNRQVASLQADLARFEQGEGGPSIQGEYATTRLVVAIVQPTLHGDPIGNAPKLAIPPPPTSHHLCNH